MNRRRTIARRRGLLHRLRTPRNRRIRPRPHRNPEPSAAKAPQPRRDWRGLARGVGRLALACLKLCSLLGLLAGVGLGGYHGYRWVMASTTFKVKQIDFEGTRRAPQAELRRLTESVQGRSVFTVDLGDVARAVEGHPWVKRARASRHLPDRVVVVVEEYRPESLVHLGYLYLVDSEGNVFKRANADETGGLAVITGIDRADFLNNPAKSRAQLRSSLAALARYHQQPRPALSELHLGPRGAISLYLRNGGLAIRLGTDPSPERLSRFDAVWAALGPEVRQARAIFLDNEVRTDRVIVRMASSQ